MKWFGFILGLVALAQAKNYYKASSVIDGSSEFVAHLVYDGPTPAAEVITKLTLTVTYEAWDRARIKIVDPAFPRWEVPEVILPSTFPSTKDNALYYIKYTNTPFSMQIIRKSDSAYVFNLDPTGTFQYNDQDIIWENNLTEDTSFFGFGERVTDFKLAEGVYTLFSRDFTGQYDDGKPPGKNMYSSQPVYLAVNSKGSVGGMLANSNAMDVFVNKTSVMYRTIGGIIDYMAYIGPTPEAVLIQHQSTVGLPVLIPYWSLGWHNCRWGYKDLAEWQEVVANYTKWNLPLDAMWTDIDYMLAYRDFTVDPDRYNYAQLKAFIDSLHKSGRRFVPITDAAIAQVDGYSAYDEGLEQNVFIMSPLTSGPMVGKVWPGDAVYVDWLSENATSYWHSMMDELWNILPFDGMWIDMNEPSDFCNGGCTYTPSLKIPYTPGQTV